MTVRSLPKKSSVLLKDRWSIYLVYFYSCFNSCNATSVYRGYFPAICRLCFRYCSFGLDFFNELGKSIALLGGMLAGHDQSDGQVIEKNGQKVKEFYGMSSKTAMEKHSGGVAEYRASEGKAVTVPYKLVNLVNKKSWSPICPPC